MNRRNFLSSLSSVGAALAATSAAAAAQAASTPTVLTFAPKPDDEQIRRLREQLEEMYRGPKCPGVLLRQGTITINEVRKLRGYKPL